MTRCILIALVFTISVPAQDPTAFRQAQSAFERAQQEPDPGRRRMLLEDSIKAAPTFEAHYALGNLYFEQGAFAAARKSYESAMSSAKGDRPIAAAHFKIGLVAEREGKLLEAVSWLEESIERIDDPTVESELKRLRLAAAGEIQSADAIDATITTAKSFGRGNTRINLQINFDLNKATLTSQGRKQADELGKFLSREVHPGLRFILIGHTDLTGSVAYNVRLSGQRAETVKDYIAERFPIAVKRIRTEARGPHEPLYKTVSKETDHLNRRVELRLVRE